MLNRFMSRYEPWAHLLLRLTLGVIFIAHGAQKLFGIFGGTGLSGTARFFEELGLTPAFYWAVVVGLVEFGGGLAVLFGCLTRYAAALLALVMLVAIARVHWQYGFFLPNGIEYPLALLGANLTLLIGGAGEWAFDRWFERHPEWWRLGKKQVSATT